jgi:hypothetical protein
MAPISTLVLVAALQASPQVTRISVSPDSLDLDVGSRHALRVRVFDAQGGRLEGAEVRWMSRDDAVARVDAGGVVTAVRPGRTEIMAVSAGAHTRAVVVVPGLPPAKLSLASPVEVVYAGTSVPLQLTAWSRLGDEVEAAPAVYESTSPSVATVDQGGRVHGLRPGSATMRASAEGITATLDVRVVENPAVSYTLEPAEARVRTGDVVRFQLSAVSGAGDAVRGFYPSWSVGGVGAQIEDDEGVGVFVAEEPGTYWVTALVGPDLVRSVRVAVVARDVGLELAKVGRGPISTHHSGDMWVFEGVDGRDYVYVGTFWHDWMMVFDVTDPENPLRTDSVQVDARRINDVKIHPNGRIGIITREGASDRRNGMVILDLSQPAHPTILSEYTETVTGGVHNVWIRGDVDLVYACHNGTSDLHIIDISDPVAPREVGRWGLEKQNKTLHDVFVQEGYAYLSYWDDGVIMLDVGAGTHGGTPTTPTLVSQYKYPTGHTHVAWRHGRYLFVGDEIFPPGWDSDAPIEARGFIHVLDYGDPENPREVGRYEVPEAGAHNVWVEDDKLYVGYYQGGLRVVDVSGELRGDLYRQGREMAVIRTSDSGAVVANWPMAWGAQVFKGRIYTSDFNSGLWITRLEQEPVLVP